MCQGVGGKIVGWSTVVGWGIDQVRNVLEVVVVRHFLPSIFGAGIDRIGAVEPLRGK